MLTNAYEAGMRHSAVFRCDLSAQSQRKHVLGRIGRRQRQRVTTRNVVQLHARGEPVTEPTCWPAALCCVTGIVHPKQNRSSLFSEEMDRIGKSPVANDGWMLSGSKKLDGALSHVVGAPERMARHNSLKDTDLSAREHVHTRR